MVRISNGLIALVNILSIVLALVALGFSANFYIDKPPTPCRESIRKPLLVAGLAIMALSLAGLLGGGCRVTFMLWLYLLVLFLLIVALVALTIMTILVTNKKVGDSISGKGFSTHRTTDFSGWLRKNVISDENWVSVKSCLFSQHFCYKNIKKDKDESYYKDKLPLVPSGCCKPPNECGFKFQNATFWTGGSSSSSNKDCKTWSNTQNQLCFDCDSCKSALNDNIKSKWGLYVLFNLGMLVLIIFIYTLGCCALKNNRDYMRKRAVYG